MTAPRRRSDRQWLETVFLVALFATTAVILWKLWELSAWEAHSSKAVKPLRVTRNDDTSRELFRLIRGVLVYTGVGWLTWLWLSSVVFPLFRKQSLPAHQIGFHLINIPILALLGIVLTYTTV